MLKKILNLIYPKPDLSDLSKINLVYPVKKKRD